MPTGSEELFERFCHANSIRWERVATGADSTPDYDAFPRGHRVVVEVTELQANDAETTALKMTAACRTVAVFCDRRKRIRKKIRKADKQLKSRSHGQYPTLAVLFDNGTFAGIDAIDVKNAMYGDETTDVLTEPQGRATIIDRLGGGRSCSPKTNTSVSAVGVLQEIGPDLKLWIFHNVYAACPLPIEFFDLPACSQFSINLLGDHQSGIPDWHRVPR